MKPRSVWLSVLFFVAACGGGSSGDAPDASSCTNCAPDASIDATVPPDAETPCTDECAPDERRCYGTGYQLCGNYDADGCREWSVVVGCAQDELCRPTDATCVESCDGEVCACATGETKPCTDVGACSGGMRTCTAGVWGACQWQHGPAPEDCDGVDNDCNGVVDDPGVLAAPACALQDGVCGGAVQTCGGAQGWLACNGSTYLQYASSQGNVYQVTEAACDGADNDCDGASDEPAQCQPGAMPTWQTLTPITSRTLHGVWGTSATNIWAVGDGGTVLHYNGVQWSAVTSNTALDLRDVWGSSANDVWAVGTGVVIRWNGSQWSVVEGRTGNGTSVWGTSSTNVYVTLSGSSYGAVDHWNGSTWTLEQSASAFFSSVAGSSASNVWAVGPVFLTPRRFNGTTWSTWPTQVSYLRSVWVPSTNLAWGVGDDFGIKKFDGSAWQDVASPISGSNAMAWSVWGRATDDVWAVGNTGAGNIGIAHYNGNGWQLGGPSTTINNTAYDVWGSSATNMWVVGGNGLLLHYAPS